MGAPICSGGQNHRKTTWKSGTCDSHFTPESVRIELKASPCKWGDPLLQNNQSKTDRRCGSSGGEPALQACEPLVPILAPSKKEKKKKQLEAPRCSSVLGQSPHLWELILAPGMGTELK